MRVQPTAAGSLATEAAPIAASRRDMIGTLRFIRYAFMPNRLRYCGGDDERTLFDYAVAREADAGLTPLVRRFTGALPYLQLIARSNGIADPFDERVVEAYWIGNELLEGVEVRQLYDALLERFGKQLQGGTKAVVLGKAPAGANPHHSFHVFDIHRRLGELESTMDTLDRCRVSWGRVVRVEGGEVALERQPLELREGRLVLGSPRQERALRAIDGRGFIDEPAPGSWVTVHWGWVCEELDARQRVNIERYTRRHIAIANTTL